MHINQTLSITTLFIFSFAITVFAQKENNIYKPDVLRYEVVLEPDIKNKQIQGSVGINFLLDIAATTVAFNCGNLQITKITGKAVVDYEQKNRKVIISLSDRIDEDNQIQIAYKGSPSGGIVFVSETEEVYTVFSTSQWMVCNDAPNDRAKLKIDLLIPSDKTCVASGDFTRKVVKGDRDQYSWIQNYESPSYTYGFAIGSFHKVQEVHQEVSLNYFSTIYSNKELESIFNKTSDMLDFFIEKSGVPYIQTAYSQILIGNHYQEMSGVAVLKNSYGKLVLKDSTETNLISHELAHQWWGNMITCENWNHFWLNEGLATFMSAAYNEHRFGEDKYNADINSYFEVYNSIKNKGKDKSLVFADWKNPTKDDRNLVYFKGAYVLHLLRSELGEEAFWDGIKFYSQKYFGKSVNTLDFQQAMEESTGQNLELFFNKWVYGKDR